MLDLVVLEVLLLLVQYILQIIDGYVVYKHRPVSQEKKQDLP